MSKQKQDKQGDGWKFPRPLEIIKCKEGNKEYMKERPARKPYGRIVKVCEFSLEAVAEFGEDDARAVWRLAKRAARDFLRVSWINTAFVLMSLDEIRATRDIVLQTEETKSNFSGSGKTVYICEVVRPCDYQKETDTAADKLAAEIERVNADNRALRRKIERLERELQKARAGE